MSKRRTLKIAALSVLILIAVIVVAGFFVLRSQAFHRYVLTMMVDRAEQAVGSKVAIGDFAFHLPGLRVDLYRVGIKGAGPDSAPPLLRVDHVGVNLKIISLLQRQFGLRAVEIDHPIVHFTVDAEGRSNLPTPPVARKAGRGGTAELFRLAINRFVLRQGEIDFSDRQVPLEAVLRHLQVQAEFDAHNQEYSGLLRYRNGEIQINHFQPVPHSLDLHFSASPSQAEAEPLIVQSGKSRILVQATARNYNHPSVTGSYSIKLATADAAQWLNSKILPAGDIITSGSFSYQGAPHRTLLDSLSVAGRISSPGLSFRSEEARGRVEAVRGHYRLQQGNLTMSDLEANVLGGRLKAHLELRNVSGSARGTLTASLRSISLAAVRAALPRNRWAKFPVQGGLNATAQASWEANLTDLRAHSDATLSAMLGPFGGQQPAPSTPVQATVHVTYDAWAKTLTFRQSVLRTPQSTVSLNGTLADHSTLAIMARSNDLHATDDLLTEVRRFASTAPSSVRPLGISGSASFRGSVQGGMRNPVLAGLLTAEHLKIQQARFPHLQTQLSFSRSKISLTHGELEAAHGTARFQASVGLRKWTYTPSAPAALQLSASNMSVADIESLAHLKYPVNGNLAAEISVRGSLSHPVGQGTVRIVKATAWSQPIQSVMLHFNGTGNAVQSALHVQTPAGSVTAHVTYRPQSQAYNGEVDLREIHLSQLHVFEKERASVSGVVTASIRGQGTLKSPQAQASVSIPALRVGGQTITGVSSQATIANHVGKFTLSANFSGIPAQASGTVRLAGEYPADIRLSTGTIEAGPLLGAYLPGSPGNIRCQAELQAWLRGPLKDPKRLEAQLQMPTLRLAYQSFRLSNVSAITARYEDGTLVLNPVEMKGTGSDFRLEATAPLHGNGPIRATASGTVDLQIVQMIEPGWTTSGQLRINAGVSGSLHHPNLQGQAQILHAAFEPPNAPIGIQDLNATLALADGHADITTFSAKAGGGSLIASGSVAYAHGAVFSLAVSADHVRLFFPEGVREVLGGQLRLSGTLQSALIAGKVSIDQLSLTPAFDLTSLANQFNVVEIPSGETAGFLNTTRLNVALRTSHELSLRSSQLSLEGAANLRVEGTLADPVIVGRATLSGGELFFNGRRYQLQSGVIDFLNPVTTQPVVNLSVVTTIDQYTLTMNFVGPFDRMRTTYSSQPPLSQADIINLLITGHAAEAPGTSLGAQSILAQGAASQISSRVQRLTGISSLTIDPQMGGNGQNPGARIAVQQRVTSKLFFTFSVDTRTTQDAAVQVQYQLSRRLSVQVMRDQAGGYSLQIRVRKTF